MLDFLRPPLVIGMLGLGLAAGLGIVLLAIRTRLLRVTPRDAVLLSAAEALVVASLAAIVVVALRPNPVVESSVNFVPLSGIVAAVRSGSGLDVALANLLGNLVIFIPLGAGLGWRCGTTVRRRDLIAAIVACSVAIEATQMVLNVGRASDIDDVLMNGAGGWLGILAGIRFPGPSRDRGKRGPFTLQ